MGTGALPAWYYLSDRLGEARTQSVAGRNKIEYYLSDRLGEARTQSVAGRNKIEYPASKLAVRSDGYLHRCA